MPKKIDKLAMQRQMAETASESPRNAMLREELATIISEELDKAYETAAIVVTCGKRGLALKFVEEPDNIVGHVVQLTQAVSGMHRAIELAQRADVGKNWFESDLNAALAGAELLANLAAEYAKLVPNG